MRRIKVVALWDYIIKVKDMIWSAFEYKVSGGEAVIVKPPVENQSDGMHLN